MAEALSQSIRARVEPGLAVAVEVMAERQGQTVSQYLRQLAMRDTALDERAHDDPPEDDADLVERAVAGLAGAGHALIERARTVADEDKESLIDALVAYVVYGSSPRINSQDLRVYAGLVSRRRGD